MAKRPYARHSATLRERLDLHAEPFVSGRCRLWLGSKDRRGYGQIWWCGRLIAAHRAAWEAAHGPIPAGLDVLHHCDTPACINAFDCLFLGTAVDNAADMVAKGRNRAGHQIGSQHGCAKLTEMDVLEIRALFGVMPGIEIAARYGVSKSTISGIRRQRNWKHVTAP